MRRCTGAYNNPNIILGELSSYGAGIYGVAGNVTILASNVGIGNSSSGRSSKIELCTRDMTLDSLGDFKIYGQSVSAVSSSGTLANAITGINNLITALKALGLLAPFAEFIPE